MRPLISIIIPTFNSEKTLSQCLDSVFSQTFSNYEVIIIDGFSSDNTVSLVKQYEVTNKHIKWLSEKDIGIYDAMNKGIKIAKGDWLFFLGSDDFIYNTEVLSQVATDISNNPKSRFIFGDVYTSLGYIQKFNNYTFDSLVIHNICHQAIFYHRSLFEGMCYDTSLRLLSDWDFNLKVFRKENSPFYVGKIITSYNMDGASNNWTEGDEFIRMFSNKKQVYLRYKGASGYYKFLVRRLIFRIKHYLKNTFVESKATKG